MKKSHAVLWSLNDAVTSGRFQKLQDRIELHGRVSTLSVPLETIARSSIRRGPAERLRGLPVLTLELADGTTVQIASLGGPNALHELASLVAVPNVA